jgi:hypothetical protein
LDLSLNSEKINQQKSKLNEKAVYRNNTLMLVIARRKRRARNRAMPFLWMGPREEIVQFVLQQFSRHRKGGLPSNARKLQLRHI